MRRLAFLGLLVLVFSSNSTQATRVVLDDVPRYDWWYGCTPTAAGSLMAYWDSQPGFENFYKKGDAQVWSGDGTAGTRRMVASQNHINGIDDPPDSLASFLHTTVSDGATYANDLAPLLEAFAEWDDTSAYDMKDGYEAIANRVNTTLENFETYLAALAEYNRIYEHMLGFWQK